MFTSAAEEICHRVTYQKAVPSLIKRVDDMLAAGLSLLNRALTWNTFCVSTLPCPASIVPLPGELFGRLRSQGSRLFPAGSWFRHEFVYDVGMAFNIRGGPRDPVLVAQIASLGALGRGGLGWTRWIVGWPGWVAYPASCLGGHGDLVAREQ